MSYSKCGELFGREDAPARPKEEIPAEAKEGIIRVAAEDSSMDDVNEFIDDLLTKVPFSAEARAKLDIAVEDLFVNIAHYAYGEGKGEVTIYGNVSLQAPYPLTLTFEDWGQAFNPLDREPPDLTPAVRRRTVGGLGIFLMLSMADEVTYERQDEKNRLTIKKNMA